MFWVKREVYVTLQGSKTGKETKVKLKIKAGRRHAPIQSSSGAVTLSESGQIVETFNPEQLPEEIKEIIKEEKIIEKLDLIEEEKILEDIPDIMEEVEPDPLAGTGIKPGQFSGMVDTGALEKLAKSGGMANLANLGNLGKLGNLGNLGKLNLGLGKDPAPKEKASPSTAAVVAAAKAAAAKAAAAKKAAALASKLSSKGIGKKSGKKSGNRGGRRQGP